MCDQATSASAPVSGFPGALQPSGPKGGPHVQKSPKDSFCKAVSCHRSLTVSQVYLWLLSSCPAHHGPLEPTPSLG